MLDWGDVDGPFYPGGRPPGRPPPCEVTAMAMASTPTPVPAPVPAPTPTYIYRATLVRVVDGDTYELLIDLGMRVAHRALVRLHGFYAPESRTAEGQAATARASELLTGQSLVVQTFKDQQTFARWLADVYVNGRPLPELLREAGVKEGGVGLREAR